DGLRAETLRMLFDPTPHRIDLGALAKSAHAHVACAGCLRRGCRSRHRSVDSPGDRRTVGSLYRMRHTLADVRWPARASRPGARTPLRMDPCRIGNLGEDDGQTKGATDAARGRDAGPGQHVAVVGADANRSRYPRAV